MAHHQPAELKITFMATFAKFPVDNFSINYFQQISNPF